MADTFPHTTKEQTESDTLPDGEYEALPVAPVLLEPVSPPASPVTPFVEPIMEGAIPARAMYPFGWSRRDLRRTISLLIAGLAAGYFLYLVWSIVLPFLISFFLAALLDPTLRRMEEKGCPRGRGILMIYLLTFLVIVLIGVLLLPPLSAQIESLSKNYESYYNTVETNADRLIMRFSEPLHRFGIKGTSLREIMATQNGSESWIQRTSRGLLNGVTGLLQEAA